MKQAESSIQNQPTDKTEPSKKDLTYVGLALFSLLAITVSLQLILISLITAYAPHLFDRSWFFWILSLAPLYLAAYPVCLLIMKKARITPLQPARLGSSTFLMYAMMSVTLMYVGNIIGTIFTTLLDTSFNLGDMNAIQDMILGSSLLANFIFAVILAPVAEEYLFRKLLIDRTIQFGERTAIMMSALFFGLFHGNFSQFFYAFGLGALFAFIYIRTGLLRYVIALHMIINFTGSVLAPLILSRLDMDALDTLAQMNLEQFNTQELIDKLGTSLAGFFTFGLYILLMMSMAFAGLVLLIMKRKSFKLHKNESSLQGKARLNRIWLNPGILLFLAGCAGLFAYNLLAL